jgi:tetratricopeptide (TPR) repeat protein
LRTYKLTRLLWLHIKVKTRELGLSYLPIIRLKEAYAEPLPSEDTLKKAIELNPKNDKAYLRLGWCYQKQGRPFQAADAFRKAMELNPKNDPVYIGLGWSYQKQGNLSQAEDVLRKAIELNPENDLPYRGCSALYEAMGKTELAREYANKANSLRSRYYVPVTVNNYRKLKEVLTKRGIRLVCVQYPMRSIEPLKKIFEDDKAGIIFVDNEKIFRDAVKKDKNSVYFRDMFAGDFGHCTDKGNRLLAENIANAILKEVFNR